jgi:hypothetical protein
MDASFSVLVDDKPILVTAHAPYDGARYQGTLGICIEVAGVAITLHFLLPDQIEEIARSLLAIAQAEPDSAISVSGPR